MNEMTLYLEDLKNQELCQKIVEKAAREAERFVSEGVWELA